ncbi:glycoside hydrolase family 18 protein [Ancylobacter sp. SL191]|uniref:glycoside hydrolase family 18 protein n=1 Tax=Ancylobacter sp. SL191 TaxID=2995166 RepID=UPI00226D7A9C|nr:glycoside hydrolase family 18 protein [Ancylobacter sp. SL191]WAC25928.1 glycoside hydrolase family 18 protein [Ancylobacter sp. SL191]
MVRHPHSAAHRHQGPRRQFGVLRLALAALACLAGAAAARAEPARPFLAYQASWYEPPAQDGAATTLARLPAALTHVALAFVKPDLAYTGGLELAGTGLQYPFSGAVLKDAIAALKARAPATRVLLAVGGATYGGWDRLDTGALARLVTDLGADGVDIDYEPTQPACLIRTGWVACASDATFISLVRRLRDALPRPYILSIAGWSVGAYGEGAFANAPPPSPWRGSMIALLRAPEAAMLDLVAIMSYDAGPHYQPLEAFRAYRSLWKGPLALGIPVLPPTQGEKRVTLAGTAALMAALKPDPLGGAMLYALNLTPPGPPGPDNPDASALTTAICIGLELEGCTP